MPVLGLDYAASRPGGRAIASAGYRFVCRYLSPGGPSLPGKLLTLAEYTDLKAYGVAVVCNWETTATRMRAGAAAGRADATQAAAVVAQLGIPATRPIYFSADFDATPDDQVAIDAYLIAAAGVIGAARVGVYGGYWTVQRCLDNRTARWAWQTGAWSPSVPATDRPDRHQIDPRAHIYQRVNSTAVVGGVQCDINEALQADFGQYLEDAMTTPADSWNYGVTNLYGQIVPVSLIVSKTEERVADLQGKVADIETFLNAIGAAVDPAAMKALVEQAVRDAIAAQASGSLTLTVAPAAESAPTT